MAKIGQTSCCSIDNCKQVPKKCWHTRLIVLTILLLSSVLAFLLGCAARISYELHIQFNLAEELSSSIKGTKMIKGSSVNNMAALIQTESECLKKKRIHSDVACNEAAVHPGMISHPDPKRVAVFGDDVGIIREILKHRTVDRIDVYTNNDKEQENLVSLYDHRVVRHDANSLLQEGFENDDTNMKSIPPLHHEHKYSYDIMIMTDSIRFGDCVFIVGGIYKSLADNGVLVLPLGSGLNKKYHNLINCLQGIGFESLHVYEETHCGSVGRQSFLVAFKDYATRSKWYRNEAEIQIELRKRTQGESPLLHVDASTMLEYQVPSKTFEVSFCNDKEEECYESLLGMPSDATIIPASLFEVKKSKVSDMAGRGIFALQDIPLHSVIALDLQVNNFSVLPSTWKVINSLYPLHSEMSGLDHKIFQGYFYFILGYGYSSQLLGETQWTIDSSFLLFSNHGCHGTFNYGDGFMTNEDSVSLDAIPDDIKSSGAYLYDPFLERHLRAHLGSGDYTLCEVKQGEEILSNYLAFVDANEWSTEVMMLRSQCSGKKVGEITDYESGKKSHSFVFK